MLFVSAIKRRNTKGDNKNRKNSKRVNSWKTSARSQFSESDWRDFSVRKRNSASSFHAEKLTDQFNYHRRCYQTRDNDKMKFNQGLFRGPSESLTYTCQWAIFAPIAAYQSRSLVILYRGARKNRRGIEREKGTPEWGAFLRISQETTLITLQGPIPCVFLFHPFRSAPFMPPVSTLTINFLLSLDQEYHPGGESLLILMIVWRRNEEKLTEAPETCVNRVAECMQYSYNVVGH